MITNKNRYFPSLFAYLYRRYQADDCTRTAAALTYTSLFAVVPLMTVIYAMLSMVPAFQSAGDQLNEFIFSHFIPASGQEIQQYLQQFSHQARKLTGAGIVFLLVTAILMLRDIEKALNRIWQVHENRSGVSSFLLYWAILTLGPICIGLAFAISTYLLSLNLLVDEFTGSGLITGLLPLIPYLLTATAFTLLFAAVPNCKVPLKNALAGGLCTALVFEAAKWLFTKLVANTSFTLIYGTFAAIPLFLFWIYLSWQIVLAGAELTHALNGFGTRNRHEFSPFNLGLAVLELLWRKHQDGDSLKEEHLLNQPWLFQQYCLSPEQWSPLREKLLSSQLVRIDKQGELLLARDLSTYSLWELSELLDGMPKADTFQQAELPDWYLQCQALLEKHQKSTQHLLAMPVDSLFKLAEENI